MAKTTKTKKSAKKKSPAKKSPSKTTAKKSTKRKSTKKTTKKKSTTVTKAEDVEVIAAETEAETSADSPSENRRQDDRRKVQRRRQIDPTTCERDYSGEEIEFMRAMDDYKRASGRMFPTCSEILEVIRDLGYVRVIPETADVAAGTDATGPNPTDGDAAETNASPAPIDGLPEAEVIATFAASANVEPETV